MASCPPVEKAGRGRHRKAPIVAFSGPSGSGSNTCSAMDGYAVRTTTSAGIWVFLRHGAHRGENVRPAGEDVAAGGEALPAGTRVGPRQVAEPCEGWEAETWLLGE